MKINKDLRKCRDYTAEAKDYLVKAYNLISLASREVPGSNDDSKYEKYVYKFSDYLQDTFSRAQENMSFVIEDVEHVVHLINYIEEN